MLKLILICAVAVFSFGAAGCWYMAGFAAVSEKQAEEKKDREGLTGFDRGANIIVNGNDLPETLALQSRWNRAGALCAAIAASIQGVMIFLGLA